MGLRDDAVEIRAQGWRTLVALHALIENELERSLQTGHDLSVVEFTVLDALSRVDDPEIGKPITELDMVEKVEVDEAGLASVKVLLTISGCPMKGTIEHDVHAALQGVEVAYYLVHSLDQDDFEETFTVIDAALPGLHNWVDDRLAQHREQAG